MKYWAPFDAVNPNDGYVNGNPGTGVRGSIPDARGLEQPQRELISVLDRAGITPDQTKINQVADAIEALIAARTLAIAGTVTYYINSASGNDANAGTAGAPLQTIHEAINRGRQYRAISFLLQTDITLTSALPMITGTALAFFSTLPGTARTITFTSDAWTTDPYGFSYSLRATGVADYYFEDIAIVNNITNVTLSALIHCTGGQMVLKNCSYSVVSASARPLIRVGNAFAISFQTVTYNATAAAKILTGIAAGANPNVWPYSSNLAAL